MVHSGDGDGWDINRPAMGSIVLFQAKVYLIDAGPNIQTSLDALGIGVNEIDGVFSTHCHDDHFAGLTQLIRSDRRVKYFSVPLVRASIEKKLAAVLGAPDLEVRDLFEVHDLELDQWNDIDGLEVLPFISPHPVETTCLRFRVFWEGGYRTYAHLADIASREVLEKMVVADDQPAGISQARFERTKREYAEPANVKKIDIGGGAIHGQAVDFRGDASGRLILAHTDRAFTEEERAIGSGAPFSTIDVLIEAVTNPLRRKVFEYLCNYYPDIPLSPLRHLMNTRVVTFNPETLIIKQGEPVAEVLLVISGNVEMLRPDEHRGHMLFGGALLGEISTLLNNDSDVAYRAVGFVQALRIPGDLSRDFVERNSLYRSIVQARQESNFLRRTWLFGEGVSAGMLNRLVLAADVRRFEPEALLAPPDNELLLIQSGSAMLEKPGGRAEQLNAGDHFGARALGGLAHRVLCKCAFSRPPRLTHCRPNWPAPCRSCAGS